MSTTFEEILARDGYLVYRTQGTSMLPLLRQDRDLVVIRPPDSRLRKHDVALYKRGDSWVLHRVVGVAQDHYLIRGDNTYAIEHVPFGDVFGVLVGFQRKGRDHSVADRGYRRYVRLWCAIYPVRALCFLCRRKAVQAAKKLGIAPHLKKALRRR